MKQDKREVAALEIAVLQSEARIAELADLQLALVGGGIGDVVFS
jgi:hypothetical protein